MPKRILPFVTEQIYHVYNRGVEKRRIFNNRSDYKRFIATLDYYQYEGPKPKLSNYFKYQTFKINPINKIVQVLAYCLMPNHFHLLVKQTKNNGITEMITKTSLSYAKYYNTKYNRVGPLLQGQFKAVLVESDEQLVHLSRYIHLNPISSFLVENLREYEWSSYSEYIRGVEKICLTKYILNFFKNSKEYTQFIQDQVSYAQELELIKHKVIEED